MLTTADIEECLSRAYVYAVAGRADVNLADSIKDYGTDGTFREVERFNGKRCAALTTLSPVWLRSSKLLY